MTPVLAGTALALLIARAGILVALHVVPSPYRPLRDAVSDYAVGPTYRLVLILAVVTSCAWWALSAAFGAALAAGHDRSTIVWCLALAGVAGVAVLAFPTDLEGTRLTPRGLVHYVLAIAGFGLVYSPANNIVHALGGTTVAPLLAGLGTCMLVTLVAVCVTIAGPGRRVFGLVERAYLASVLAFYLTATSALLSR